MQYDDDEGIDEYMTGFSPCIAVALGLMVLIAIMVALVA